MTFPILPLAALAGAFAWAGAGHAQTLPTIPRTMIVMDGSGSMWGQIDGVPKLEIARRVVGEVLAGMDPGAMLGLIAYGHRRRGDCSDIEVMVDPTPGSAGAISQAVQTMRFQGRTPLTEAVRRAAEVLRATEDPATVVLVTDGIETCEADPCALGRELEASGVNFTAHVVGFGLSADEGAQVACLAQETGGRYFQADDAAGLTEALTQTLAASAPPPEPAPEPEPEPRATPPAPDQASGPWYPGPRMQAGLQIMPTGLSRGLGGALPAAIRFPPDGTAAQCQSACAADDACTIWQFDPPGSYVIAEARCHMFNADAEFDYAMADAGFVAGTTPAVAQFTRAYVAPLPPASVTAPDSAAALGTIAVRFEGPMNPNDYIDIIEAGATRTNQEQSWTPTRDGSPALVQVPATPGAYQIRYVQEVEGRDRVVLATRPLTVTDIAYALEAPAEAQGGSLVSIAWQGPQAEGDYIDVIEAGELRTHAAPADAYLTEGNPLTLILPLVPGAYEIRYVVEGPEGRVVALRRPLTVTPPVAALVAAPSVAPGAEFAVSWEGPANARNWIDVVVAGRTDFSGELAYAYLDPASRGVTLTAPGESGVYELRFVAEDMRGNRAILARRPLAVGGGAGGQAGK